MLNDKLLFYYKISSVTSLSTQSWWCSAFFARNTYQSNNWWGSLGRSMEDSCWNHLRVQSLLSISLAVVEWHSTTELILIKHNFQSKKRARADLSIAAGVPQGAILRPLLFICHMADIPTPKDRKAQSANFKTLTWSALNCKPYARP